MTRNEIGGGVNAFVWLSEVEERIPALILGQSFATGDRRLRTHLFEVILSFNVTNFVQFTSEINNTLFRFSLTSFVYYGYF